jgi:ABC-type multidrug transport system fused ATPase/permease subunit
MYAYFDEILKGVIKMKDNLTFKKIIKDVWRIKKSIFIYSFILTTFNIIKLLLATYMLKYIFDRILIDSDYYHSVNVVIIYGIILLFIEITNKYLISYKLEIANIDFKDKLDLIYCSKIDNISYENFENSEFKDIATRVLSTISDKYLSTISIMFTIYGNVLLIIGLTSLVVILGTWIVLFVILSVLISTVISLRISKNSFDRYIKTTNRNRFLSYQKTLFYNRTFVAENMIYNNSDFFKDKYITTANQRMKIIKDSRRRLFFLEFTKSFNEVGLIVAVFIFLTISYFYDKVGVGDIASLINASQQLSAALLSLISILPKTKEIRMYIKDTNTFLSYENDNIDDKLSINAINSIEFKDVRFKYPKSNVYAIQNINFKIKKGMKVSIVGENGAGKTTIIKLLSGLYQDYEGDIYINGINIKELNLKEYRHLLGVVFQDFNIYPITVLENIVFNNDYDEEEVIKRLKEVNLYDKIESLDYKADTVVSKEFDKDGTLLSGGEMQKIAIVRALNRIKSMLIVDEAFSHIDAKSEALIYELLMKKAEGKILVSVSHRLATTQNSDLIIVLDNGIIHETGNHKDLMSNKSIYYEMFETQKNLYL